MIEDAVITAQRLNVTLAGPRSCCAISRLRFQRDIWWRWSDRTGPARPRCCARWRGWCPPKAKFMFGGEALSSLSLNERARRFAYLPQGHLVHWPLPARDIVALGRYPHGATDPARLSAKDAEAVLRAMQAADVVQFIDRQVTELSGGERSRVALARVLAVEAPVILADEPTSSLDPRHQLDVMQTLRAAADKGALVIVVTHDLGLAARFSDNVLVLSEGRLVAQGRPEDALSEQVMGEVFRVSAFRAEYQREIVIMPWAEM